MGLNIDDVSVVYPAADGRPPVEALSQIALSIERDDFVVALGASGCGKSTLLNLIAGFLSPTSGDIVLDGSTCRWTQALTDRWSSKSTRSCRG
jgi:taurine transport system ATP-binding protein